MPPESGPDSPLPYLYGSSAINGQLQQLSPAEFLAANPRTPGSMTLTIGGTITNNDVITVTFTAPFLPNGSVSVTATAATGDTTETLAEKIAKAINDNQVLDSFGAEADDGLSIVTVSWYGPLAASVTVTKAVSGSATETVTLSASNPSAGGGPVIPYQNFLYAYQGQAISFYMGIPQIVSAALAAALAADGQPVS